MNDKLINRLKQDGEELDQLAAKRLAEAGRIQPLWEQSRQHKTHHRWFWGLAASMALAVGLVTNLNDNQNIPSAHSEVSNPIMLVDEQLRAPLKAEQQAIIDDLKTLKQRFISI